MKVIGIIPARYSSIRLPGKALKMIGDKTMIRHVYERCLLAKCLDKVIVATDHEEIFNEITSNNGEAHMTSPEHPSGTDRCAEVVRGLEEEYDFVINIQGDEPFIDPEQIDGLASLFTPSLQIATLVRRIEEKADLLNPNIVKVVKAINGSALYFSRAVIPAQRDPDKTHWMEGHTYWHHIGMYGYRTDILMKITKLPVGQLERTESLEQLRWLENGYHILTGETDHLSMGIDTDEDLQKARGLWKTM